MDSTLNSAMNSALNSAMNSPLNSPLNSAINTVHSVELLSLGVLAVFVWQELRSGQWRDSLPLGLTLMLAALWGEDSCIRLYQFYQYSPDWHFILDKMPPMVALIWPFVILSDARVVQAVARAKGQAQHPLLPLAVGALVIYDASLMEVISVNVGLWSWNEPGIFEVPIIGILGWGYFAAAALWLRDRLTPRQCPWIILLAPTLTHLMLLATWWGGLRWILREPLPGEVVVGVFTLISLVLSTVIWRLKVKVGAEIMGMRLLAASLFGFLLVANGWPEPILLLYVATFVPPYVLATHWRSLLSSIWQKPEPRSVSSSENM